MAIPALSRLALGDLSSPPVDSYLGIEVLVEFPDLEGDLHLHTRASDGKDSIKQMLLAARGSRRDRYELDMIQVIREARNRACFLELNAQPKRLDLIDRYCKVAKDEGVLISISSDAPSTAGFDNLHFGIGQARRGWLTAESVLNTRALGQLRKLLGPTLQ